MAHSSGKSSLILSLLQLVDLNEGTIAVDGVDISTISRQEIRERLISIPQDLFTLPGSIRSNADTLGTASDEEIISALKKTRYMGDSGTSRWLRLCFPRKYLVSR